MFKQYSPLNFVSYNLALQLGVLFMKYQDQIMIGSKVHDFKIRHF